jgi:hypothetical protein
MDSLVEVMPLWPLIAVAVAASAAASGAGADLNIPYAEVNAMFPTVAKLSVVRRKSRTGTHRILSITSAKSCARPLDLVQAPRT